MKKEYIKPFAEVIRIETESLMAGSPITENTTGATEREDVDFDSRRKHLWGEDAWGNAANND